MSQASVSRHAKPSQFKVRSHTRSLRATKLGKKTTSHCWSRRCSLIIRFHLTSIRLFPTVRIRTDSHLKPLLTQFQNFDSFKIGRRFRYKAWIKNQRIASIRKPIWKSGLICCTPRAKNFCQNSKTAKKQFYSKSIQSFFSTTSCTSFTSRRKCSATKTYTVSLIIWRVSSRGILSKSVLKLSIQKSTGSYSNSETPLNQRLIG